jgi:hypothetical protein
VSVTVLWQARSRSVRQLNNAVRRTEENRPEPVYPPLSDAPEKRRGVMFPHPTGKCRWQCEAAPDPLTGVPDGLLHFISPAGEIRLACGLQSRCYAAGVR